MSFSCMEGSKVKLHKFKPLYYLEVVGRLCCQAITFPGTELLMLLGRGWIGARAGFDVLKRKLLPLIKES